MKTKLITALAFPMLAANSQAATIAWAAPVTVTADTDVNTNGTLISATTFGFGAESGVGATVNGATFTRGNTNATNGATLPIEYQGFSGLTVQAAGFDDTGLTGASADLNNILDSFAFDGLANVGGVSSREVILRGLVPTNIYEIQLFASDDRTAQSVRTQLFSDTADRNATTASNSDTLTLGASSYVIGTFTADAATQSIFVHNLNTNGSSLNAAVLRDVTPPLIPEPSSSLLAAFAGLMLLRRRR